VHGSLKLQHAKKSPKNCHLGTITQLCRAISSQLRHVSTIGKNLSGNISFTCSHNMVNFSILAADIGWPVWGTPANFNGFCVLAALLHGTVVVGVSQTAVLNRGRHLYSAGRPSRWALGHISSWSWFLCPWICDFWLIHELVYFLQCFDMTLLMVDRKSILSMKNVLLTSISNNLFHGTSRGRKLSWKH